MASAQISLRTSLDAILQDADSQIDKSSDNLTQQLQGGISLNQNDLKFSFDRIIGLQKFEICARGLTICWGNDQRYWNWNYMPDCGRNNAEVEVAELSQVWWLDVSKKFPTKYLCPMFRYTVSFVIMKLKGNQGFHHPVHLKLVVPGQKPIERDADLSKLPENEWKEIVVGEFSTFHKTGDLEVTMYEHGRHVKKGIVVNKLIISAPIVPVKN